MHVPTDIKCSETFTGSLIHRTDPGPRTILITVAVAANDLGIACGTLRLRESCKDCTLAVVECRRRDARLILECSQHVLRVFSVVEGQRRSAVRRDNPCERADLIASLL